MDYPNQSDLLKAIKTQLANAPYPPTAIVSVPKRIPRKQKKLMKQAGEYTLINLMSM